MLSKEIFKGNRINFTFSVIFILLFSLISVFVAVLLQMYMDVAAYGELGDIPRLLLYTLIYILGYGITIYFYHFFQNRFIEKGMYNYKNQILYRLLSHKAFDFRQTSTGVYLSALTNDIETVRNDYLANLISLTYNVAVFIFALATMAYYNIILCVIAIATSSLSVVVPLFLGKRLTSAEQRLSAENGRFVTFTKELLSSISLIKSFCAEMRFFDLFKDRNKTLEHLKKARKWQAANISILSALFLDISTFAVYAAGVIFVINGVITAGAIIAFVQLLNNILGPISSISDCIPRMRAARQIMKKIEHMAEDKSEGKNGIALENCTGNICIRDLSFSYSKEKTALSHIDYEFLPNKSYGIIGDSGSGKSTLIRLLMNYFPDYEGSICLDGTEIRQISDAGIFSAFAIIEQEVFIFDASIKDNITLFSPIDDKDLEPIIHKAGLDKLIAEKGLMYLCGENGLNLSGGERQRISIARALLKNSKILLVDEGTAALDQKTAVEVEETILKIPDTSKIVITHRLLPNLLEQYDDLIILKQGKIVEHGRFSDLMQQKGALYQLYQTGNHQILEEGQ